MTGSWRVYPLILCCLILACMSASAADEPALTPDSPLSLTVIGEAQEDYDGLYYVATGIDCEGLELVLPHKAVGERRQFGSRGMLPTLHTNARVSPASGEILLLMTAPYSKSGMLRTGIYSGRYAQADGALLEGRRFTAHVGVDAPRVVDFDFCFTDWSDGVIFAGSEFTGRVILVECDARGRLIDRLVQYVPGRTFSGMQVLMIEDMLDIGDEIYLLVSNRSGPSFMGRTYKLAVCASEIEYSMLRFTQQGTHHAAALAFSKKQPMPAFDLESQDAASVLAYQDFGRLSLSENGVLMAHVWENDGQSLWRFDRELTTAEKMGEGDPALVPIMRYFEYFAEE